MADPDLQSPHWDVELDAPFKLRALRAGAHADRVSNASNEPARVLLVSATNFPEIAEHVDTGTVLAMTAAGAGHVFPAGTDRPVMEMLVVAMEAASEGAGS